MHLPYLPPPLPLIKLQLEQPLFRARLFVIYWKHVHIIQIGLQENLLCSPSPGHILEGKRHRVPVR